MNQLCCNFRFLGLAGGFAILTKAGITTAPPSAVSGNKGASPIISTAVRRESGLIERGEKRETGVDLPCLTPPERTMLYEMCFNLKDFWQ